MALGAFIAWVWLPEIQKEPTGRAKGESWPRLPSKNLEELAEGYAHDLARGDTVGAHRTFSAAFRKVSHRWKNWRSSKSPPTETFGMSNYQNGGGQNRPQTEVFGRSSGINAAGE